MLAGLEQGCRPKAFFCSKHWILTALQQVFLTLFPQALLECCGVRDEDRKSGSFSILPPQVTALSFPTIQSRTSWILDAFMPHVLILCELALSTQTTCQLRGHDWLQDSAGFGLAGEAFKASNECKAPHEFLRLNFFPSCSWAEKAG